jgi:hypothetical protein
VLSPLLVPSSVKAIEANPEADEVKVRLVLAVVLLAAGKPTEGFVESNGGGMVRGGRQQPLFRWLPAATKFVNREAFFPHMLLP